MTPSSFVHWTAGVDGVVSASAAETGGTRHVRFLTDTKCNLIVDRVTLSATGDDNFDNTGVLPLLALTPGVGSAVSSR